MSWVGRVSAWTSTFLPRTGYDYKGQVGDGSLSSIVMACVNFVTRTFPESPLAIWEVAADGEETPAYDHPLINLVESPNPYYGGGLLWQATLRDYNISGNAYWLIVRAALGNPAELWYAPSFMMTPCWPDDGSSYLSHYEYKPNASLRPIRIRVEDVIHFRDGIDPHNTRKGLSKLAPAFREIFTDEEASNYAASLLKNLGIPGVIISPDSDIPLSAAQAEEQKKRISERFTGDRRGEPWLMAGKTKVQILSFRPDQMDLRTVRSLPEERVSGLLGIPAIVAGLGAGLERSTFSNTGEAREAAYESNIIPTQRVLAEEIRIQLLPEFDNGKKYRIGFDTSKVRVLQDDQDKLVTRLNVGVQGGWIMVSEARTAVGLPVEDKHKIFLMPAGHTVVKEINYGEEPEPLNLGRGDDPNAPALPPGRQPAQLPPGRKPKDDDDQEQRSYRVIHKRVRTVKITDEDIEDAIDAWNEIVDEEFEGLLDAPVEGDDKEGQEQDDGEADAA